MKKSNLKLLKQIVEKQGDEEALKKLAEECLELSLAITQYFCPTKSNKKRRLEDIHKEAADVQLALRGAKMLQKIKPNKINTYANKKLKDKFNKLIKNGKSTSTYRAANS